MNAIREGSPPTLPSNLSQLRFRSTCALRPEATTVERFGLSRVRHALRDDASHFTEAVVRRHHFDRVVSDGCSWVLVRNSVCLGRYGDATGPSIDAQPYASGGECRWIAGSDGDEQALRFGKVHHLILYGIEIGQTR